MCQDAAPDSAAELASEVASKSQQIFAMMLRSIVSVVLPQVLQHWKQTGVVEVRIYIVLDYIEKEVIEATA